MLLLKSGGRPGPLRTTTRTEGQVSEATQGPLCEAFSRAAQLFTLFLSYTTTQIISRHRDYYRQMLLVEKRKNNYNLTPQTRD